MEETIRMDDIRAGANGMKIKTGIKAGMLFWDEGDYTYGEGYDWEFDSSWEILEYLGD